MLAKSPFLASGITLGNDFFAGSGESLDSCLDNEACLRPGGEGERDSLQDFERDLEYFRTDLEDLSESLEWDREHEFFRFSAGDLACSFDWGDDDLAGEAECLPPFLREVTFVLPFLGE